jgi:hypothetical protein
VDIKEIKEIVVIKDFRVLQVIPKDQKATKAIKEIVVTRVFKVL